MEDRDETEELRLGAADRANPKWTVLLLGTAALLVFIPNVLEWRRGPVPYRPGFSDEPLLWTRGRLVMVSGLVVGTMEVRNVSHVGNYVTGEETELLAFVQHESGVVVPALMQNDVESGDVVTLRGRLRPTFPSLRSDMRGNRTELPDGLRVTRTLQVGGGPRGWLLPVLAGLLIWLGYRLTAGDLGAPWPAVSNPAGRPVDVFGRDSGVVAGLLITLVPVPFVVYLADGIFRVAVLPVALAVAWHVTRALRAPYLVFGGTGLLVNGLLRRTWISWFEVRQVRPLMARGHLAGVEFRVTGGQRRVRLTGILHSPVDKYLIVNRILARVGADAFEDWPESVYRKVLNASAAPVDFVVQPEIRQRFAFAVAVVGLAGWWGATVPSIANDEFIFASLVISIVALPFLLGALVIEV